MKISRVALVLLLGVFSPALMVNAAKVAGLGVSGDASNLNLFWDKLSTTDYGDADGYAIQWSDRQTNVQIDDSVSLYRENNLDDVSLRRASFENDLFYFARIYTYKVDENNNRILGNGSDMLKFKITFQNDVTTETIAVTDPIIVTNAGSNTTTTDTGDFEFGELRKVIYDTFADFSWSRPRELTSSEYDGFMVRVSTNSDMADPVVNASVSSGTTTVRVTDLNPDTQYYAQGHFYKDQGGEKKTFGDSDIKAFRTIAAVPRDSSTRASRGIIKIERKAIRKVSATGGDTSTSTATTTDSSSASSSSSSSSSSTTNTNTSSVAEARAKVSELKAQISRLQADLRRWEARAGISSSSSTSTTSSFSTNTSTSTSGLSIRERLRLRLAAKRNK